MPLNYAKEYTTTILESSKSPKLPANNHFVQQDTTKSQLCDNLNRLDVPKPPFPPSLSPSPSDNFLNIIATKALTSRPGETETSARIRDTDAERLFLSLPLSYSRRAIVARPKIQPGAGRLAAKSRVLLHRITSEFVINSAEGARIYPEATVERLPARINYAARDVLQMAGITRREKRDERVHSLARSRKLSNATSGQTIGFTFDARASVSVASLTFQRAARTTLPRCTDFPGNFF